MEINEKDMINLAIEGWRLSKLEPENDKDRIIVKRFVNKLVLFLNKNNIEIIDLTNQLYEVGMSLEVIFTEENDIESYTKEIIVEMISPLIKINNCIAKYGQVITKKISE